MANLPLAFAELLAGGLLLTVGITGNTFGEVIAGDVAPEPFVGATSEAESATDTSVSSSSSGSGASGATVEVTGLSSSLKADVDAIAKAHGWDGAQISDWFGVINDESNGTITDENPGSTAAYGIAQFYDDSGQVVSRAQQVILNEQKYYEYGGNPNSVGGQLEAMANYIADRYGDPAGALNHENEEHWY